MLAFDLLSNLDTNVAQFIALHGNFIYILLFGIVFLEISVFPLFFLPGNPLIFIAGSFCKLGSLELLPTIFTLLIASLLGNGVSYRLGKIFGAKIGSSEFRWVNQEAIIKTHGFYEKYGNLTLTLSPFIAIVRTFAPLLAGVGNMPYKQFFLFSSLGLLIWVVSLTSLGYFMSSIAIIQHHMASIVLSGLVIGLGFLIIGFLNTKRKQTNLKVKELDS